MSENSILTISARLSRACTQLPASSRSQRTEALSFTHQNVLFWCYQVCSVTMASLRPLGRPINDSPALWLAGWPAGISQKSRPGRPAAAACSSQRKVKTLPRTICNLAQYLLSSPSVNDDLRFALDISNGRRHLVALVLALQDGRPGALVPLFAVVSVETEAR